MDNKIKLGCGWRGIGGAGLPLSHNAYEDCLGGTQPLILKDCMLFLLQINTSSLEGSDPFIHSGVERAQEPPCISSLA